MIPFRAYMFAIVTFLTAVQPAISFAQISAWQKRLDGLGQSVGINPLNPNTIYGQNLAQQLCVSRNQGKTWTALTAFVPFELRQIIVHPKDTLTLFITDFWDGLRKSTDGGISWKIVLQPFGIDGESVTYDIAHPDTMYAGDFATGNVFRSTARGDSGTWVYMGTVATNLCTLEARPDSANILLVGSGNGRISKSTNSGVTWHLVKSAGSTEIPKIVIDHTHPQIAYGTAFSGGSTVLGVWKTTNGGENWFKTALPGINVWALDIDQTNPNVLYAGTFDEYNAGVYKTTDAGASWTFNNKGIQPNYSFWNIHIDPIVSANVYAGLTVGSFGTNGIYKLSDSNAGIEGFVRDSLTNAVIMSGTVGIQPANQFLDLASTNGKYSYYRFAGDTATSQTFSVTINSYLFKQQTRGLINDSIQQIDIFVSPGSIRGTVYNDINNNGVKDGGEPGIPNWTMLLTGQASASVMTDVNGDYSFTDLFPGTYFVAEQARNGWSQTAPLTPSYTLTISLAQKDYTLKDFGNHLRHGVVSVVPASYANSASPFTTIQATFDTAVTTGSVNDTSSWIVTGKFSGRHRGSFSFNGPQTVVTFTPDQPFQHGELVFVDISSGVKSADAIAISPYNYQFAIEADAAPGAFVGRTSIQTGTFPWGVAVGDIDGDGDNDIVVANSNSSTVSVIRNNGGGTFGVKTDYGTGSSPIGIILVDVDRDGDLDIVCANNGNSNISLLRNNGDGTFAPRTDYSATFAPFSVESADLNGDGYPDLVIGGPGSGSISVLLNNGSGGFTTHQNYTVSNSPWTSVLGDLDNDGTCDDVSIGGTTPGSVQVLGNLGDGTLGTPFVYTVGPNARCGIIADITGDGLPDLVATNSTANNLSILPKNGSIFGPSTDVPTGGLPWGVTSGDLNGDSLNDLVVANVTSKTISLLKNNGNGTFTRTDYGTGTSPRSVVVADLDGDGDLDVVVSNSGSDSISVYMNSVATTLSYATGWNLMSLPLLPADLRKSSVYPGAASNAFAYNGSYVIQETLSAGSGFWIKFAGAGSSLLRGEFISADTTDLRSGWNMIGALSSAIGTGSVSTIPPGILVSNFYNYNGSYHVADSLVPGYGYWIKSSAVGKIVRASSGNVPMAPLASSAIFPQSYNTLTIRDRSGHAQELYFTTGSAREKSPDMFELPPPAPGEELDVRFASGRMLEEFSAGTAKSYPIRISNSDASVTIAWKLKEEGTTWTISTGGETRILRNEGTISADPQKPLVLGAQAGTPADVPRAYALEQNFPNPFNPSTEIKYALPVNSSVKLTVMNILGQEIVTLVDGDQGAGFHSITWQPSEGSGLYFYAIRAVPREGAGETFSRIMKMVFVK